jgi:hypothetical protein
MYTKDAYADKCKAARIQMCMMTLLVYGIQRGIQNHCVVQMHSSNQYAKAQPLYKFKLFQIAIQRLYVSNNVLLGTRMPKAQLLHEFKLCEIAEWHFQQQ